jgi:hypothetical protein
MAAVFARPALHGLRTMGEYRDLPVLDTWPPERPGRTVVTVKGQDGRWYVIVGDPLEIVGPAASFATEGEAWDWIEANCERGDRIQ